MRNTDHNKPASHAHGDAQFYSELLRAYFDSTQDAIFVLCDEMKFITCNKTTEHWLGSSEQELTLHNKRIPITQLLGKDYAADKFSTFFNNTLNGHSALFETQINPPMGKERWVDINLSRVDIEDGNMVIAVARDISERKKHLATIKYKSHHDELTGLPNRTSIIEHLDECQNQYQLPCQNKGNIKACELVLLVLDIDRFKDINESLGYKLGDFILQEIARRLSHLTSISAGEFTARLSSDEFAIVFPNTDLSRSRITAQRIRQIILQPIIIEAKKISLDCAIGIATLPTHTNDSTKLIQLAEMAMYHAKSQKLGISIYNTELSDASGKRLQLVTDLREALKNGHIKTYYQPIINMHTKSLHIETLARWQHPQHGEITPDIFITLAEETGNINKLTSTIMDSALQCCATVLNKNLIENLSINISPYCLTNPKLSIEIRACLKKYGVSPGSITLEITESAMMSNSSAAQKNIEILQKLGLSFSIDDFGTGYSSLSKLKHMPLRELKIDKSFITDINQCENDAAITNAAIQMAHSLGLDVVAEGIENEATWDQLRQMGCDYGQGYWIAKPMPFNDLLTWVNNHHTWLTPPATSQTCL